jgi:hypothetical protein
MPFWSPGPPIPPGLLPAIPKSSALEGELLYHFRQLDEEQQKAMVQVVKALKDVKR